MRVLFDQGGQIGPVGLVVSPTVLVRQGVFVDRQRSVEVQARLTALPTPRT